jgi:hypothetical protein
VIRWRWQDAASLMLVVLCAFFARFDRLSSSEFFHDEAMVSMMAQEMAHGQTFPLQGILSSVGIPNPPTSIYAIVPPFAFSSDPLVATGYVAALNVLAAGVLWVIARREFGSTAALFAGLAFALNPWAILYSRKIWAQDYVMPFLLMALWLGLRGFNDGKRWAQALMLPLMLFAMQIHIAAWALVPLFGWLVWHGRRQARLIPVMISIVLGIAMLMPYLLGLAQTLSADPTRLSDALNRSAGAREPGLRALALAGELAAGINIESWMLPDVPSDSVGIPPLATSVMVGLAGVFLLTGVAAVSRRHRGWLVGFGLWIVLPVAAFQVGLADIWPHYFVPQIPAFALLTGVGMAALVPSLQARPTVSRLLLALASVTAFFTLMGLHYANWNAVLTRASAEMVSLGRGTSGYTTPIRFLNDVRDAVASQRDVVIVADGMDVWFDVEAARWPVILRDSAHCVRTLPPDGFAVFPESAFALVIAPSGAGAPVTDYYPPAPIMEIPARMGEGSYRVAIFERGTTWRGSDITPVDSVVFENDVTLRGYALEPTRVTLRWSLPEAPSRLFYQALDSDYQVFVHLLDSAGNRVAQSDSRFWPGRHWCAGDTLMQWLDLEIPADAALMRVGFYRLNPDKSGSPTLPTDVLDVMGNAAGQWLDIPLP